VLTEHRDKLDSLTEALLREETLDQDDAYRAAGVAMPAVLVSEEPSVAAARQGTFEVDVTSADQSGS
jgi:hypothetical protein